MITSHGRLRLFSALLAASTALAATSRAGAEPVTVGQANRIQNLVSASLNQRRLSQSDPVFAAETISAGERSHGEIVLTDDSKVLVGENSEVVLDEFVLGPSGFQSATLNVAKGAFRFISGNSARGTIKIRTPLSSIGIRGTIFDVYVREGGETDVVLLQGAVRVCNLQNNCIIANRPCDIVQVSVGGEVSESPFLRSAGRSAGQERSLFGLTANQGRFDRPWRAPTIACNGRAAFQAQQNRGPGGDAQDAPDGFDDGGGGGYDPY